MTNIKRTQHVPYRNPMGNLLFGAASQSDHKRFQTLTPQAQKVLHMIRRDGHITRQSAVMSLSVANLTARIAELRSAGFDIICKERNDVNGNRYGRWSEKAV